MWQFLGLSGIFAGCLQMAFALACAVPGQVAAADGIFRAGHGDPRSVIVADTPTEATNDTQPEEGEAPPNLRTRNFMIIGTGATAVTVYGWSNWWHEGFGGGFKAANEGWFAAGTEYGGADKAGHAYANYAAVRLLVPSFKAAGNTHEASVSLAAWSTLGVFTGIEVVDGFSRRWRFSFQDAIMNAAGVALGVVLETRPELDEIIDFRLDYRRPPSHARFNPFGDYSMQKYLFVVKADGFASLRENRFLRYLELAAGYGTRGYETGGERHRDLYVGISLNLARLLGDTAYDGRMHSTRFQRGTDVLFDLVQFPAVGYMRRSLE